MANDRVYLVCKRCGFRMVLMKYYPSTGLFMATHHNRMDDFLEEHLHQCQEWFGGDLEGDPRFLLETE